MAKTTDLKPFTYADYANVYDTFEPISADFREAQDYLANRDAAYGMNVGVEFRKELSQERMDHLLMLDEARDKAKDAFDYFRDSIPETMLRINHESPGVREVVESFANDPYMSQQRVTVADFQRLQDLGDGKGDAATVMSEISQEHRELDASRDTSRFTLQDYQVADEMADAFRENGFSSVYATSPADPRLEMYIDPSSYSDMHDVSDVDYFLVESNAANIYGSDNLVEVAHTFNTLPEIEKQAKEETRNFEEFAEKSVYGRTQEQWDLAGRVSHLAYDSWRGSNVSYADHLNQVMPDIAKQLQLPLAVANDAMQLSENASMYSDWSKDLTGRRNRYYGESDVEQEGKLFGGLRASEYDAAFAKENPGIPLRDRAEVYEAVDAKIHGQEVREVPYQLVDYVTPRNEAPHVVVHVPEMHYGDRGYAPDMTYPFGVMELPLSQVKQNENGTFNLLLDDRQRYDLDNGFTTQSVGPGALHNTMSEYRLYCRDNNISIEGPQADWLKKEEPAKQQEVVAEKEPTVLRNMGKNSVQFFQTKDGKDMAAVSVPHEPSPYGSGKIYVPAGDVQQSKRGYDVTLKADSYTVNYNAKDDAGNTVRMHDKGISVDAIKTGVDNRQREMREARVKSMGDIGKSDKSADTQFEG